MLRLVLVVLLLLTVGCKRPQLYSEDADGRVKPNKPRPGDLPSVF